jgi:hypothetical protein
MNIKTEIVKAERWARRKPTAKQKAGVLHTLEAGRRRNTTVSIDDSTSASWRPDGDCNLIAVGDQFMTPVVEGLRDQPKHAQQRCRALLRHEAAHGTYTDRDLPAVAEACRAAGVPFRLLGLFEDARIEHLAREEGKTLSTGGRAVYDRFRFWATTPNPDRTASASTMLWCLINREASSWSSLRVAACTWDGGSRCLQAIFRLYGEAIRARRTLDLVPVCMEWIKRFGAPLVELPRTSGKLGVEECPTGVGAGAGAELEATTVNTTVGELPNDLRTGAAATTSELSAMGQFSGEHSGYVLDEVRPLDPEGVRQLAQRLTQIVKRAGRAPMRTATSGARLHMPGVISGAANSFRGMKAATGKRTLTLVMDMSSSMLSCRRAADQHTFMLALMLLHRRGILTANIWLSGNRRRARVNPLLAASEVHNILPVGGRESIRQTLSSADTLADVMASDLTVVYTDGHLTDGDIDSNEWRLKGVDLVGACTWATEKGDQRKKIVRKMSANFATWYCTDTPVQLAGMIVNHLARK